MRKVVRKVRYRLWRLFDKWNERRHGISTSGNIQAEEFGLPTGDDYRGGLYMPSSWSVLRHVFKELRVSGSDVFVDYGSGKGRVLIIAAREPFKRVIGVEMTEELNEVARENIDRNRNRLRCRDIEVITCDATKWQVPDDLTIAYLYAPFPPHMLEQVLGQLYASLDRRSRPLRLVYFFMSEQDREVVMASGRATPLQFKRPLHLRGQLRELWMYELR